MRGTWYSEIMQWEALKQKREEVIRLAEKHGAYNVRVFGSVARGEAGPQSDVDILVAFGSNRSLLNQAALIRELAELLGTKVDVVSDNGIKPGIRERILKEALPL